MVNGRNIFTYFANIFMLTVSLVLFVTIPSPVLCFRLLTIICLGSGGVTTIFYVVMIKENALTKKALELDQAYKAAMNTGTLVNLTIMAKKEIQGKQPSDWLKEAQFYFFGLVYMFARLALNCNATMMPFYLISSLQFKPLPGLETSPVIALVPLISYMCSLVFTLKFQKPITQRFANRFIPMLMALIVTTIGALPLLFVST